MSDFVHLHLHSEYSLLDGACRIADIPKRAKECGHTAVALTDHGVMYGAVAFYLACKKENVKPIIGCEVYVAPESRFHRNPAEGSAYHLILLCENETGYRNLIQLVSAGFTEGFYSKPRIDMELLRHHTDGLIALSACLSGQIPRLLLRGDKEGAKRAATELSELFGKGCFFIELQNHGLADEAQILPDLVQLAKECHLPLVATNDCHYLRRTDAFSQKVLTCIQTASTVQDSQFGFATDEFYYKDSFEMRALFGGYPEAMENTVRIAERCRLDFDFSKQYLPKYPCPVGESAEQVLRRLALDGMEKKHVAGLLPCAGHEMSHYEERMEYELGVIAQMGYSDYFLIVWDYVHFAKSHDIPVGPGRGSGAGSLVAYLLGITNIDSIRYDLLFERFLNPERVSMPDIDVDFCYSRRDEVIAYVTDKYGADHVSQIITFGTLAARAAIRDVGRALGMSYQDVDPVARAIPQELDITIRDALERKELRKLYDSSEQVHTLVDTAMAIEGMPRNVSIHAAGIVITDRPLTSYLPLSVSGGTVITQYDMDTVARLGLLKFDFLALRYLTILHDAEMQIREKHPDFRLDGIPLDDAETYEMIGKGNTLGVFQLESPGMRNMLMNLKPRYLDDIIAAIALFRPGPMESIPKYIEARHDPSKVRYDLPQLEPILRSTYGCTVYQEQVMGIFRTLAGYSFGHADIVRRAMSKKKADVLAAERPAFLAGCLERGITETDASRLFDDLSTFANYAFNKSHAAAYAVISYQTAYLKAHYTREYYAALLTSVLGNLGKMAVYIAECSKLKIRVLPPDINESHLDFHVDGTNIRYGLLALKNIGKQFVENLIEKRKERPFASFDDFVSRMTSSDLNKRMVETLVKAGAFDRLGVSRSRLVAVYESILDATGSKSRANLEGQLDFFSMTDVSVGSASGVQYPDIPEYSLREKLMLEKEVSGMYFSGHPFDAYVGAATSKQAVLLSTLVGEDGESAYAEHDAVRVAGLCSSVSMKNTKNGSGKMAFFTLEDAAGEVECVLFPKQFQQYASILHTNAPLLAEGTVSLREDEAPKVLVNRMEILSEHAEVTTSEPRMSQPISASPTLKTHRLCLRFENFDGQEYAKAKNLVSLFEGTTQVLFFDSASGTYHNAGGIQYSPFVQSEFVYLLGKENVVYQ